jgi:type II secretion system protein J
MRLEGRRGRGGFTLLEVLVAVALSAVAMMAVFSMFDTVTGLAADVARKEGAHYDSLAFEAVFFDDLRSLYLDKTDQAFRFGGNNAGLLDEAGRVMAFATTASLAAGKENPPFSVQRVEYVVREREDGSRVLVRRERPYCGLMGDWEWADAAVLAGFEDLDVEYFDATDGSFADRWQGTNPPRAVRVEVTWAGERKDVFEVDMSTMGGGSQ